MVDDDVLVTVPVILPVAETAEAFAAYDRPVLVIDNTPESEYLAEYGQRPGFTVLPFAVNLGVARSWNVALGRGAPLTVILSQSVVFEAGLTDAVSRLADAADEYGCFTTLGLHAHAWTPLAVEMVGRWDENFWPGWYEDNDYLRRAALLGVHTAERPMPKIDIPGARTEYARTKAKFDELATYDHAIQARYYAAKWGGVPGEESYETPFDSGRPLLWWPMAPNPETQRRQHAHKVTAYTLPLFD